MPENLTYRGLYAGIIIEVRIETHPTPTQLQDWKDLWTWLLSPCPDADTEETEPTE
jgi:hypothetical protein